MVGIKKFMERIPGVGLLLAAVVFFSLNGSDAVSGLVIDTASPLVVAALTMVVGAIALAVMVKRAGLLRPGRRQRVRELGMTPLINRMAVSDVFVIPFTLLALDRLEALGTVISIMWFGPLWVAIWKMVTDSTRRLSSLLWLPLAGAGVVFLTRPWEGTFDILGVLLALGGAVCYANFLFTYDRMGAVNAEKNEADGVEEDRISVAVAESHLRSAGVMAILTTIAITVLGAFGLTVPGFTPGPDWLSWPVFAAAAGAGLLTGIVATVAQNMIFGWGLLKGETFAVLTAFEPMVALALGWWVLGYQPVGFDLLGTLLVSAAGFGCYYQREIRMARIEHHT